MLTDVPLARNDAAARATATRMAEIIAGDPSSNRE
jgi:hypothetical protein